MFDQMQGQIKDSMGQRSVLKMPPSGKHALAYNSLSA